MRRMRFGLMGLGATLLVAAGCQTAPVSPLEICQKVVGWRKPLPDVKPPKRPEELNLPPADDARFSEFPTFTQEQLDEDLGKKAPKENHGFGVGANGPAGGPSFGAGGPGGGMPGH